MFVITWTQETATKRFRDGCISSGLLWSGVVSPVSQSTVTVAAAQW